MNVGNKVQKGQTHLNSLVNGVVVIHFLVQYLHGIFELQHEKGVCSPENIELSLHESTKPVNLQCCLFHFVLFCLKHSS